MNMLVNSDNSPTLGCHGLAGFTGAVGTAQLNKRRVLALVNGGGWGEHSTGA